MKKTLTILLTLCLIFTMLPVTASAAEEIASGTHGDNITWVLTKDGTLIISGEGNVERASYADGYSWYSHAGKVKKVVFEEGVTNVPESAFSFGYSSLTSAELKSVEIIDYSAFNSCATLASVTLPDTLKEIRNGAFACTALTSVDIPEGVTEIGNNAFLETKLTEIIVPEGVVYLGDGVFSRCTELKSAHLPDSVKSAGMNLFAYCTALETANIPAGLSYVPDMMFDGCTSLKEIEIPYGISILGMTNFRGTALTTVTIPVSVTFMGSPFMDCLKLKEIFFVGDAPEIQAYCFQNVTATAYYPEGNATWTEDKLQNYGGTITWVPYEINCTEHSYIAVVTEPTCTEQGYTTYTCTTCGHSYVDDYTDPVDHVYEGGNCKWCGEAENYVNWSSISTSLGGNIAMNFYVELSENLVSDPDAYIQFAFAGRTIQVPLSEGKPSDKNGVTVYQFSCPITSKNMTDEITAQVYNADGAVGEPKSMSVDTYCNWVIANFKDEKTVNLMKGMLNYGASAQKLFNYRTDDLANATLAEEDKVFGAVDASAYKHTVTGTEEGIITKSMTLLLDSETTVRVYFELTGDKTIEEFTFTVDGVKVEPTFKDGKYYIERPNISAHRLDDMHVFTCGGITVTYGGLSYVNQVMTYYTEGATFEMASALFAYSKAAEAYIG